MLPRDQPLKSHQLGGSRDSLLHMLKPPRCDVDDDETDESDKNEEVDGTRAPPAPQSFLYTREIDSRRHSEYCREICELLHRVVTIEAVRLWREVEVGVQHEGIPGLHEYIPGGGHQTFPLRAGQKTDDEEGPGEHKPVTVMKWQNRGTPTVWR